MRSVIDTLDRAGGGTPASATRQSVPSDAPARERGQHPLLVADIVAWAGIHPLPKDADITLHCPECLRLQSLADAVVEPSEAPDRVTDYWCMNGCTVLVSTGRATWRPRREHRVGEFVYASMVPAALHIFVP